MKPVLLKIRGFNSFMQERTIDFRRLSGLFGIFGPVGSGKSSVLDAVIMSLYGRIPRSRTDAEGCFINSNSSEAYIYFEFETAGNTYVAERFFSRKKQVGVKNRPDSNSSRFYVISDGVKIPLSEGKQRDINNAVESVIGLGYSDFQRAVVLPQGKFSDFLMLANLERKDMLERIFNLYEYGERLNMRAKKLSEKITGEYEDIKKELDGYSHITPELLEEKRGRQYELTSESDKLKRERAENDLNLNRLAVFVEYGKSLKAAEANLYMLQAEASAINLERDRLELAKSAEGIIPLIRQSEQTLRKINEREDELKEKKNLAKRLAEFEKATAQAFEESRREKEDKLPSLLVKLAELERSKKIIRLLEDLKDELRNLQAEYTQKKSAYKQCLAELEQAEQTAKSSSLTLEDIRQRKAELSVSCERRQKISVGARLEEKLIAQADIVRLTEKELSARRESLARHTARLEKARAIEDERDVLKRQLDDTANEEQSILVSLEAVKNDKAAFERGNLTAALASAMKTDEPCPVCGSKSHPNPAEAIASEVMERLLKLEKALNERLKMLEKDLASLNEKVKKLSDFLIGEFAACNELINNERLRIEQETASLADGKRVSEAFSESIALIAAETGVTAFLAEEAKLIEQEKEKAELEVLEQNARKAGGDAEAKVKQYQQELLATSNDLERLKTIGLEKRKFYDTKKAESDDISTSIDADRQAAEIEKKRLTDALDLQTERLDIARRELTVATLRISELNAEIESQKVTRAELEVRIQKEMENRGFSGVEQCKQCFMNKDIQKDTARRVSAHEKALHSAGETVKELTGKLENIDVTKLTSQFDASSNRKTEIEESLERVGTELINIKTAVEDIIANLEKTVTAKKSFERLTKRKQLMSEIEALLRGKEFVNFVAKKQLRYITSEASARLRAMSAGKYSLELADTDFIVRDLRSGSLRPPSSLSGGEVFIVSLCLALSLSSKIQLKNRSSLDFFFLDEGFGSLDKKATSDVLNSLYTLEGEKKLIGLISHKEQLMEEIGQKIMVIPAEPPIKGTDIEFQVT